MSKLTKYDSFQALKNDDTGGSDSPIAPTKLHQEMADFMTFLRLKYIEESNKLKEKPKSQTYHAKQFSQKPA